MNKHYDIFCKYNKTVILPALVVKTCVNCDEPLCPACGYIKDKMDYCNECYEAEKREEKRDIEIDSQVKAAQEEKLGL